MVSYFFSPPSQGKGRRGGLKRPSTFFSTLAPNVLMKGGVAKQATPTNDTSVSARGGGGGV